MDPHHPENQALRAKSMRCLQGLNVPRTLAVEIAQELNNIITSAVISVHNIERDFEAHRLDGHYCDAEDVDAIAVALARVKWFGEDLILVST